MWYYYAAALAYLYYDDLIKLLEQYDWVQLDLD